MYAIRRTKHDLFILVARVLHPLVGARRRQLHKAQAAQQVGGRGGKAAEHGEPVPHVLGDLLKGHADALGRDGPVPFYLQAWMRCLYAGDPVLVGIFGEVEEDLVTARDGEPFCCHFPLNSSFMVLR